jgi:hypothetical protein
MPNKLNYYIFNLFRKGVYTIVWSFIISISNLEIWHHIGVKPILITVFLYLGIIYNIPFHSVGIVFCVSMVHDGLNSYPFGVTGLASLIVFFFLSSIRSQVNAQDFYVNYAAYAVTAIIFQLLIYGMISLYDDVHINFEKILLDLLFTIALFPLTTRMYKNSLRYMGLIRFV